MNISFSKYQGAGNDFIVIDNRSKSIVLSSEQVQFLCDRHFGIGSDGLILIEKGSIDGAEFDMVFYNPDGSQSLCGNGSRCAVQFALASGMIKNTAVFNAYDGLHKAEISGSLISISMKDVTEINQWSDSSYFLNTGSPHHVTFEWPEEAAFLQEAMRIRYDQRYSPGGANVNFVKEIGPETIQMRTYERGVENETLSCGTGVTAAALAFAFSHPSAKQVNVQTKGGSLRVDFVRKGPQYFSDIVLSGPAQFVFSGNIEI